MSEEFFAEENFVEEMAMNPDELERIFRTEETWPENE